MMSTNKSFVWKLGILGVILMLTACASNTQNVQQAGMVQGKSITKEVAKIDGFEIKQVNRQFIVGDNMVTQIKVKVGEQVNFKNADDTAHNIFSTSKLKTFDLGAFMPGETRSVSFSKPGKSMVECAIHPQMRLDIDVK